MAAGQLRMALGGGAAPLTPEEEAYLAEMAAQEQAQLAPAPAVSHAENVPSQTHIQSAQLSDPTAYTGGAAPATAQMAPSAPAPQPDYGASPRAQDPYAQEYRTAQMPSSQPFPAPTSVNSFPDQRRYTRADYSGVGQPATMLNRTPPAQAGVGYAPNAQRQNAGMPMETAGRYGAQQDQSSLASLFGQAQDQSVAMKAAPPKPPRITKAMMEEAGRSLYQKALGYDPRLGPNTPPLLGLVPPGTPPPSSTAGPPDFSGVRPSGLSQGINNPADAMKSVFGSQADMAPPGFDPAETGLPTNDWATMMSQASQHANPEVEAGRNATNNSVVYNPGIIDKAVGRWFTERTSDEGRRQNRETLQGAIPDDWPQPDTIQFQSEAGIPNFDRSPGKTYRPKLWGNAPISGVLNRARARNAAPQEGAAGQEAAAPSGPSYLQSRANNPDLNDSSFVSRRGTAASAMRDKGLLDADGNFTEAGLAAASGDGVIDANGAWNDRAVAAGIVPPEAIGKTGAHWLSNVERNLAALGASGAGQPLDPNATIPVTPAASDVAATATGSGSDGDWNSGSSWSSGRSGGGRSWRNFGGGGGGGWSMGGGGRSSGGFSFDDADLDWESLLKDFDMDGDIDEKDERKAKSKAMRRRGRRSKATGNSRVAGAPAYQTTPERERILGVIAESQAKGGKEKKK